MTMDHKSPLFSPAGEAPRDVYSFMYDQDLGTPYGFWFALLIVIVLIGWLLHFRVFDRFLDMIGLGCGRFC